MDGECTFCCSYDDDDDDDDWRRWRPHEKKLSIRDNWITSSLMTAFG